MAYPTRIIKLLTIVFMFIAACSCNQKESKPMAQDAYQQGYSVIKRTCTACHSPIEKQNNIAPTLIDVKTKYLEHFKDQESFIKNMTRFLQNPTQEQSKLPKAVSQFSLMPYIGLAKEDYEAVAAAIFNSNLKNSDWLK